MAPNDPDESEKYPFFGPGETVDEPGQHHRESLVPDVPEPKYQHEEWLYQQYAILGKTLQEIADDCGVQEKTIWRWVQKFDIETRSGGPRPGPWKDEDWLQSQYIGQQKSVYRIADEQDCDEKTIRNWLAEHDIETRDHSARHPASRTDRQYQDRDWLREQYVERQRSAAEIAADCEASTTTIYRWLDRYDIDRRSVADARQLGEATVVNLPTETSDETVSAEVVERSGGQGRYRGPATGLDVSYQSNLDDRDELLVESPYRNEEWLRDRYETTGSAADIAETCDVSREAIYYWMDKFGIERSWGDADAPYRDEAWLREAYADLGTLEAVAEECEVAPGTIRNWLVRFDIDRNPDAVSRNVGSGRPEKDDDADSKMERLQRLADAPEYAPDEIKRVRDEAGLTQSGLAERVGAGKSTVRTWEMGWHTPSARYRLRIREIEKQAQEGGGNNLLD